MTALSRNFSGLLYYNPAGPGFNAVEQVTITSPASIDEGGSFTVNLVTWGIPDGTVLAHTFPLTNISPLRFNISPISPVANNRASFFIAVNSDNTTASGAQSFDIQIRKTVTSNVLATKTITINDTSQTPAVLESYIFNGSSQHIEVTGTTSDWALGTTWTIEWWSKATTASGPGTIFTVMSQYDDPNGIGIDIYYQNGNLIINNNGATLATEPTPGEWTHIALVNNAGTMTLYYNGTSVHTGGNWNLGFSTGTLVIGKRGQIPYQYFLGKLTGIRITNTLVYTGSFDPYTVALPPTKVSGTKLLMTPSTLAIFDDLSDSNHGVGPSTQVAVDNDYPPHRYIARKYSVNTGYASNQGGNEISVLIADYPDIVNVPSGATVTWQGNTPNSITVVDPWTEAGIRRFGVSTLSFTAWGNDVLTFIW
jgi:hypothetical protein